MAEAETVEEFKELVVLADYNALEVFTGGRMQALLDDVKSRVDSIVADPTTTEGAATIRSIARRLGSTKSAIEQMRLDLVQDRKRELADIDKVGREARNFLDRLQADFRRPLTEIEEREKARKAAHEQALAEIEALPRWDGEKPSAEIEALIARADALLNARDWQEYAVKVMGAKLKAVQELRTRLDAQSKLEADRAEQARQAAAEAERQRLEREEQIRQEERTRAEREAENLRREKEDAERRAREAEEEAARARAAAAEKEQRDAEDAVRRQQAEKERLARAEAERQERAAADAAHRAAIHARIRDALADGGLPVTHAAALVEDIADGRIPHLQIIY
jgi:hypothetical protein